MAAREQSRDGQTVKRVELPGGKTIEVIYFEDVTSMERHATETPGLHVCPACDSALVHPIDWSEVDQLGWEVTLRCPNCEWVETGVFDQDTVERFDEELDRGTDELVGDLKSLVYANMEEQIERFSSALHKDHILPEDF
jgi:hypothetical protein